MSHNFHLLYITVDILVYSLFVVIIQDLFFIIRINTYTIISYNRYTLLVGKPPFETKTLKDTYQRIKRNEYHIPQYISPEARALISKLLRPNPAARPTAAEILSDPFFTIGNIPTHLPLR